MTPGFSFRQAETLALSNLMVDMQLLEKQKKHKSQPWQFSGMPRPFSRRRAGKTSKSHMSSMAIVWPAKAFFEKKGFSRRGPLRLR